MSRKTGLGKGLDALIPSDEPSEKGNVLEVLSSEIVPNPRQPRAQIEADELQDLAASIKEHGILQPLIVSPNPAGGYILVAGERRLRASRIAGLQTVPVVVRNVTQQEQLELALIENLQRADLNALEAAAGYRQLADEFELSHEDIARRVGKSRAAVTNTLRLLKLPQSVRQALIDGRISEGHARALLGLPTPQAQSALLQTIEERGLNVRQTEELVRKLSGERPAPRPASERTPEEVDLEDQLQQALGTRVTLKRGKSGGSLLIRFYSDEELNALVERFLGLTAEF